MIPRQRRRRLRQSAAGGPLHISSRSSYPRGPAARLGWVAISASLLLWAAIILGWWLAWW